MSLNGGGGGSGGDSGGQGDSGPGGSDEGSGHGGPGPGSTTGPGGAETGFGIGPDAESEAAASNAAAAAAAAAASGFSPDIGGIVGPGPGQQDMTGFGTDYSDADMGPVGQNAMGQVAVNVEPQTARLSPLGVVAYDMSLTNPTRTTAEKAIGFVTSPISTMLATAYDAYARGVTAPDDYSQLDTSVQNQAPSTSPGGGDGGIKTIQAYAPTYNPDTGNPTMDAYIKRLRINLGLPV